MSITLVMLVEESRHQSKREQTPEGERANTRGRERATPEGEKTLEEELAPEKEREQTLEEEN